MKRALGAVTPWDAFQRSMKAAEHHEVNGIAHPASRHEQRPLTPEISIDHATQVASAKKVLARDLPEAVATKTSSLATNAPTGKDASFPKAGDCSKDEKCCNASNPTGRQTLPHSHEDSMAHQAQHGTQERKDHHAPEVQPAR